MPKFKRTVERDLKNQNALRRSGWNVIVVWECELRNLAFLVERLTSAIIAPPFPYSLDLPPVQIAAEAKKRYQNRNDAGSDPDD